MVSVDFLVLGKGDADWVRINDFIASLDGPKLCLVFNCLKSDFDCLQGFQECIDNIKLPFLCVRSAGCLTSEGFVNDGLVFAVLSGDFEVDEEKLKFGCIEDTVKSISDRVDSGWLFVFSPFNLWDMMKVNVMLEKFHEVQPGVGIWGWWCY